MPPVAALVLFSLGTVLNALAVPSPARAPANPPPNARHNVILIVLDTVRYDAISPANTPFLDSLARRGTTFSAAYSTHDFTPPSHYSLLTGFFDGLGSDDDRPENGVPWQLGHNGYFTFGTAANGLIGTKQMPVMRGFSDYREIGDVTTGNTAEILTDITHIDGRLALFRVRPTAHARAMLYYSADRVLSTFLQQWRAAKPPYLGFVNLVDAHEPYVPRLSTYPPEMQLPPNFDGDVMARRVPVELAHPERITDPARQKMVKAKLAAVGGFPRLLALDLSPEALAIYKRRYMATVRDLDGVLRQLFDVAGREHLLDNTVVIITSDHGESFGEDGYITHMLRDHGDFESTHHVPLMIVLPPTMPRTAATVTRRVSIANLAATIYDVAGVDWRSFAQRYEGYAPSLISTFTTAPAAHAGRTVPPPPAAQDQSEAEREREKAMKSLGYIH